MRDNQSRSVSESRISADGMYEYGNPRMQQDLREFLADDPAIQRSLRLSLCLVVSPWKLKPQSYHPGVSPETMRAGSQPRGCRPLCPLQAPKCRRITTFLLREVPEISDIKFVDFTISYTAMLRHIYDEMHPHRAKSLGLKILPLSAYNSEILMPTLLQLHCFHRPGGGGYPAPFLAAMHNGAAFFLCDL